VQTKLNNRSNKKQLKSDPTRPSANDLTLTVCPAHNDQKNIGATAEI